MIPRATYRLQFREGMDFARAIEVVPYLQRLGISHLYASPIFAAVTGSTHGYDVINNNLIEPALGGMDGLVALSDCLKKAGMGLILDIVPNHMAASLQNLWWRDIVEWGPMSSYASYFDVDWSTKLTLPILSTGLEQVLGANELTLAIDKRNASLALAYFDHLLPLHPHSYELALAPVSNPLIRDMAQRAAHARPSDTAWKEVVRATLASPSAQALADELAGLSRDGSHMEKIHALQPWRLMDWRDAGHALSYRRFFEIAGLAGLRMEEEHVFDDVHRLTIALIVGGIAQGLRIDHIDGLADPGAYLRRLRRAVGPSLYMVVEKILAQDESLPPDWPVHGTTGYEFIPAMTQLFVDPRGRRRLDEAFLQERTEGGDLESERRQAKRLITRGNFAGELRRLAGIAHLQGERFPAGDLERVISEVIAAFPVYRTYGDQTGLSPGDLKLMRRVADGVRAESSESDREILDWLVMTLIEGRGHQASELRRRFQQLSSAVMAKAVEDTLFYRWNAVVALNEVGCDPAQDVGDVERFHEAMLRQKAAHPHGLLATATHDTKHGEDARARLYTISEKPDDWLAAMTRWRRLGRDGTPGTAPAPEIEWLLYQSLASIWPAGEPSGREHADLAKRLAAFLEKALREAKQHTAWTEINADYERSVISFVEHVLSPDGDFLKDYAATLQAVIRAGIINSLAQTLVKLTAPGVPDIYQGSEVSDFSLVDPDNRRPVDFAALAAELEAPLSETDRTALVTGRVRQKLIAAALALRRAEPELFASGSYEPLKVVGRKAHQVTVFLRRNGVAQLITAVPRLTFSSWWSAPAAAFWQDTDIILPENLPAVFTDALSGVVVGAEPKIAVGDLFARWPVALLAVRSVS